MNGLDLATLHSPALDGHPGTTLQALEGLVILGRWAIGSCLFGPWQPLIDAVLNHPEEYLHTVGIILNLLLSAVLFWAARRIYLLADSLFAALVFQISFGMFMEPLHAQARISPEPLLAIAVILLSLAVTSLVFGPNRDPSDNLNRTAANVGLSLALGIVTKVTFAPLLAVLLLFRTRRSLLICVASCLLSISIMLCPIWTHLPKMYRWFSSLLLHKERYGAGPVGFPDQSTFLSHLRDIVQYEPMLLLLAAFYIAASFSIQRGWLRTPDGVGDRVARLLWVGVLAISVQMGITFKHFAMHYLLPAMVFTMLLNAAWVFLLSRAEPGAFRTAAYAGTLLLLALGAWHSFRWIGIWTALLDQYRSNISTILHQRREMKDCAVIPYYRSSSLPFALSFGDDWADSLYRDHLAAIYPKEIYYNIWVHQFYSMQSARRRDQIRRDLLGGACYLMQGTPLPKADRDMLSGFVLDEMMVVGDEALYRLRIGTSTADIPEAGIPANAIAIDARKFWLGNVAIDDVNFGAGIGAIVSPSYPAEVEYRIPLENAGRYELRIRCASLDPRPVTVLINGESASSMGCPETTGGYGPSHQRWQGAGVYKFKAHLNTIRLQSTGPFPVISKLALVPLAQ